MTVRSLKKGTINNISADNTSVAVPTNPIITGTTAGNTGGSIDVSLTFPTIGATPNNYVVASTPGNFTASGNTSPLTVNGLTPATAYTFAAKGVGNVGDGPFSPSSASATTNSAYMLLATLTSTQNWVVPSGVSKIAVFATGGGSGGAPGNGGGVGYTRLGAYYYNGSGGTGGISSAVTSFQEYAVTAGQTYLGTVGAGGNASAAGGTTNFASLVQVATNTVNGNVTRTTTTTSGGSGAGAVNNTPLTNTQTITGLGAVTYNQTNGGGGGGVGVDSGGGGPAYNGGISSIGGGSGGYNNGWPSQTGNAGTTGVLRGSGGGGGVGSNSGGSSGIGAGGAGQGGAIYIYGLYAG
jgi:hypothetical protein